MSLIRDLEQSRDETLTYFGLGERDLARVYEPGKWSVRFILHHSATARPSSTSRLAECSASRGRSCGCSARPCRWPGWRRTPATPTRATSAVAFAAPTASRHRPSARCCAEAREWPG